MILSLSHPICLYHRAAQGVIGSANKPGKNNMLNPQQVQRIVRALPILEGAD